MERQPNLKEQQNLEEQKEQMKQDSSTIAWNNMGTEWIELAQTGESRILFIMPTMLKLMGDVKGKKILDLGCGEGGYSRELAKRGAIMTSVDCNVIGIEYAEKKAKEENLSIEHFLRNSNDLHGIGDNTFDVVLCSMMLMDCEDLEGTVREVERVLKPDGHMFASVLHPCFNGNYEVGIGRVNEEVGRCAVVRNYFEPKEWEAPLNKGTIPVIFRHRTIEEYVKLFIKCGFSIVDVNEPRVSEEMANQYASLQMFYRIPIFMYWELQKSR